jgi:branched-chain amino acid transport system permease protein
MVGTNRIFDLLGSLVVGGEGTLVGPVIGAAILTLLPSIFQPFAVFKTMAVGTLLILALLYFPSGIYGGVIGFFQRLRKHASQSGLASSIEPPIKPKQTAQSR